jgi:hypothetical protein
MIKQVESTYFDFQKLMRFIVIGAGLAVPIFFGYWRYTTTSEANNIRDAIEWGILSVPFSFGLWLSTMQIGKRFRHLTLGLIILSAIVHIIFSVYPFLFLPIVVSVEIYAVYTLFGKVAIR